MSKKDLQVTGTVWVNRTDKIMSGDVGGKYEDAEHMATGRIWQLKSWSRDGMITVWSRWYRTIMALSHWGWQWYGHGQTRNLLTSNSPSWLTSTVRTWEELTEWIRTLEHITLFSIRSHKWRWALFAYLIDVAMQSAWLIHWQTATATLSFFSHLHWI